MLSYDLSDPEIVAELGRRVSQHRIALNLTQAEFADRAGVGRSTVQRIEGGESIQLLSFVKILRALRRLEGIDAILAPDIVSPLAEIDRRRQRSRVRKSVKDEDEDSEPWTWGDEDGG